MRGAALFMFLLAWGFVFPVSGATREEIEMEGISIIGNRELPKVLYIVPWKKPELGDLIDTPVRSLYDEVLEPVDRDVFQRRLKYFRQLNDKQ